MHQDEHLTRMTRGMQMLHPCATLINGVDKHAFQAQPTASTRGRTRIGNELCVLIHTLGRFWLFCRLSTRYQAQRHFKCIRQTNPFATVRNWSEWAQL